MDDVVLMDLRLGQSSARSIGDIIRSPILIHEVLARPLHPHRAGVGRSALVAALLAATERMNYLKPRSWLGLQQMTDDYSCLQIRWLFGIIGRPADNSA